MKRLRDLAVVVLAVVAVRALWRAPAPSVTTCNGWPGGGVHCN